LNFWHSPHNPLCPKFKTKTNLYLLKKKPIKMKLIEKYFLNSLLSVVGAYNKGYTVKKFCTL